MYQHNSRQLEIEEFKTPFRTPLDTNNRWVRLAALIPWDYIEKQYQKKLGRAREGKRAYSSRLAFGALIIKERLKLTDEETVAMIKENPYLQWFIGLQEFQIEAPFNDSLMTHFRKRLPAKVIKRINDRVVRAKTRQESDTVDDKDDSDPEDKSDPGSGGDNKGQLIVDATVAPADITFPTDLKLLNKSRELLEGMVDTLHAERTHGQKKPRTYRKEARKAFLTIQKKRQPGWKKVRKAMRKQLGYVHRDLGHVDKLLDEVGFGTMSNDQRRKLMVIREAYRQQQEMYDEKKHTIASRIISISQPHVRSIKRNKAGAKWEFGAKVSVGIVNGLTTIHRIGWDNFNESLDLQGQIKVYKSAHGFWPESVHADKIYRTRLNMRFCKERGIRFSGQKLGRPFEDATLLKAMKKQWREDERIRNAVEGKFGEGKRKYGIDRIMAKLKETGETVISLVFLVMNMERILRDEASSCCSAMMSWFLSVLGRENSELTYGLTG